MTVSAPAVPNATLTIIREEHAAVAAVLRLLPMMTERGPAYAGRFSRIVMNAPAPIDAGAA
jgi:hypothetical protein